MMAKDKRPRDLPYGLLHCYSALSPHEEEDAQNGEPVALPQHATLMKVAVARLNYTLASIL
jgi:hypothetical protein